MSTLPQDRDHVVSDKDKVLGSSQEHLETLSHAPKENGQGVILTSAFAAYNKTQIMRKFWRLYAFGLAVSLGGMYAGYCSNAVGNIVANPGEPLDLHPGLSDGRKADDARIHPTVRYRHECGRSPRALGDSCLPLVWIPIRRSSHLPGNFTIHLGSIRSTCRHVHLEWAYVGCKWLTRTAQNNG